MIAWMLATSLAHAGLTVDPPPVAGQPSTFTLTDAEGRPVVGASLRAVHHPSLPHEDVTGAGITDSLGRVVWTPELGGIVVLYEGDTRLSAHDVAWPTPPASGWVPWLLVCVAGLGALWAGRRPPSRS